MKSGCSRRRNVTENQLFDVAQHFCKRMLHAAGQSHEPANGSHAQRKMESIFARISIKYRRGEITAAQLVLGSSHLSRDGQIVRHLLVFVVGIESAMRK